MSDPAALSRRLQQVAFELGHALTRDVVINPTRLTVDLLATSVGIHQALEEIAKAADTAGLSEVAAAMWQAAEYQALVGARLLQAREALDRRSVV